MAGLRFEASADGTKVNIQIEQLEPTSMTVEFLRNQFQLTEFRRYFLDEEALTAALAEYRNLGGKSGAEGEPDVNVSVSMVVAEQREAEIIVDVPEDCMACVLKVTTAYGAENPTTEQINAALNEAGVIEGVNYQLVESFCRKLNNAAPGTLLKETIAQGKPAGTSKPAELEFLVEPIQDRLTQPVLRDDGTVDMYDFGEIPLVEIGDKLIRRVPPRQGEAGYTVMGVTVEAPHPEDIKLVAGDGTKISDEDSNIVVASLKGVPLRDGSGMLVEDAYCVNDVDLKTGNIDFDGTVVVRGSVKDGMQVKATGKVMIQDYLESASVIAGSDVVIGKGVLGRQAKKAETTAELYAASIESDGDVTANYIQYANIKAQGRVSVKKHIMHSLVAAHSIAVESSNKSEGKVLGGVIRPLLRMTCNTLGGPSYIPTHIDFSDAVIDEAAEFRKIQEELAERNRVVSGMQEALEEMPKNSQNADLMAQITKIKNTVAHFNLAIAEIKDRRKEVIAVIEEKRDQLEVIVTRTLYPGVELRFLDKNIPIKQERDCCRIKAKGDGITFYTME